MEYNDLKELIELLKESDITELVIEKDGEKIRLRRDKIFAHIDQQAVYHHPVAHQQKQSETQAAETEAVSASTITITSPIVGTFYRSAAPDSDPFVEVGSRVKKGQILCIIEAMKLMNEIESEYDGVVAKMLVENGHAVEYGEPLFIIEPA
ncbi:MAG: acetyl-CoA carboxylase biotin carboxyl carrier protein [Dissulfurispiraceae bacterium]|jgi:acetyl-CoA carboxylase biotin carboxyl carrier protein|nr:acetyl-CoA carboxylase biotin carboxyl carrier protein [Dissulfurispiraceae bacterium]